MASTYCKPVGRSGLLIGLSLAMLSGNAQAQQVPFSTTTAQVPGPAPGTAMTKAYVQMVGRKAYMWVWTLVNVANRAAGNAKAPAPGLLGGVIPVAYNRIAMLTGYIDPNQHWGVCPNQDVVYGFGYFGLDTEPIVFQVPDFGDRFWVYAPFDARTDEFSKIGKQYGTKPGFYLMVGPNWKGDLSAGINAVVRSSSKTGVFVVARISMDDTPEDRKAIQPVLSQINSYPLSEFDGKMKTTDWSKLPNIPVPPSSGKGETKWVNPDTYFDELPTVMKQVPPLPGEEALDRWIAEAEMTPFLQWRYNGRPAGNGWNSQVHNAEWGTDYVNRTATGKSNIYDNRPEETKYIYTDDDSQANNSMVRTLTRSSSPRAKCRRQRFLATYLVQPGALDKAIIDGSWTPPVVRLNQAVGAGIGYRPIDMLWAKLYR